MNYSGKLAHKIQTVLKDWGNKNSFISDFCRNSAVLNTPEDNAFGYIQKLTVWKTPLIFETEKQVEDMLQKQFK